MLHVSCEMPGWMKHKLESRLLGEISTTSDMQMKTPYGKKLRRTKESLDESERGEWKSWLKTQYSENEDHGIWTHHFMANRWGNNGNSDRLYFGGFQNHCRWWLQPGNKKMLPPWKKSLDTVLKSRGITLQTKICMLKVMFFLVVMYGCESWSIEKA